MTATKTDFQNRISLARLAWAKYREQVPGMPVQPPALFEAGYALGNVMQDWEHEGEERNAGN